MLYVILSACTVVLTFATVGLLAAKKRLVEQQIDDLVARKLASGREAMAVEILDLKEANGVMRNLLIDIAENEVPAAERADGSDEITTRLVADRAVRRRELLAEVEAVLRSVRMADAEM